MNSPDCLPGGDLAGIRLLWEREPRPQGTHGLKLNERGWTNTQQHSGGGHLPLLLSSICSCDIPAFLPVNPGGTSSPPPPQGCTPPPWAPSLPSAISVRWWAMGQLQPDSTDFRRKCKGRVLQRGAKCQEEQANTSSLSTQNRPGVNM